MTMNSSVRVPLVEPGTRPDLSEIEASIRAERGGEVALLYKVLLNSGPLASGWEKLLTAIRNRSSVPADLRELLILRIAVLNRASFEFEAHLPHARAAGVSDEKIDALQKSTLAKAIFTDTESLVLELCDRMTRDIEVPSEFMSRVTDIFDPKVVVELVAAIAAYNMVSRFLVALNIVH
jgi:AhpD family alkylhydroperoxidase